MAGGLRRLLALPATQGLDLDDPRLTARRREVIQGKPFLRALYREFYREFLEARNRAPAGPCLEVGSGAGFLKELLPEVITSDVFPVPGLDLVLDAQRMPFAAGSLACLFLLDVLHHIPAPLKFLQEAARCLQPGGRVVMIEPAHTAFSRLIYTRLHHEPFVPTAGWELSAGGPLSGSNQALPWILFYRDRQQVLAQTPGLELARLSLHTPLAYLLSGGVSLRSLLPGWAFGPLRGLERALSPLNRWLAMFMTIELRAGREPAGPATASAMV
ncbi:MAG: class I SAM-dependent methyltransferase [Thermodesulfobacteriota bacterium]